MKELGAIALILITSAGRAQTTWDSRASCPDLGRWGVACFEVDGIGYMVGGRSGNTDLNEVWAYDPILNEWEQKTSIPGVRRVASGFSIGDKGYVTCGLYETTSGRNDLWEYDPIMDTWSEKASLPSEARYGAVGFSLDGLGYVATGATGPGTGPYVSDLWAYDPVLNQWLERQSIPDQGRVGAGAFVADGKCFVFGGRQVDQSMSNELWAYDPISNSWSTRAPLPSNGRHYTRVFSAYGKGVIASGQDGVSTFNDCWYYDPGTNGWYGLPDYPGSGGWSGSSMSIHNHVYAGMGQTNGLSFSDLWTLKDLEIGIDEFPLMPSVRLTPNPCRSGDVITLETPSLHATGVLRIFDTQGREVAARPIAPLRQTIELPSLALGLYTCLVSVQGVVKAQAKLEIIE